MEGPGAEGIDLKRGGCWGSTGCPVDPKGRGFEVNSAGGVLPGKGSGFERCRSTVLTKLLLLRLLLQ